MDVEKCPLSGWLVLLSPYCDDWAAIGLEE